METKASGVTGCRLLRIHLNLKIVCNTYVQICTYAYIYTNMYVCVHIYKYVRILSRRTYVNTKGFELKEQMAQADDVGEWETKWMWIHVCAYFWIHIRDSYMSIHRALSLRSKWLSQYECVWIRTQKYAHTCIGMNIVSSGCRWRWGVADKTNVHTRMCIYLDTDSWLMYVNTGRALFKLQQQGAKAVGDI